MLIHLAFVMFTVVASLAEAKWANKEGALSPCFDFMDCMLLGWGVSASCDHAGSNAMLGGILGSCVDSSGKSAATTTSSSSGGALGFLGLKTIQNLKIVADGEVTADDMQKEVEIARAAVQRRLAAEANGEIPIYGSSEAVALEWALKTYGPQI